MGLLSRIDKFVREHAHVRHFVGYVLYGIVPAQLKNGKFQPENTFYKTVYHLDRILGFLLDMLSLVLFDQASKGIYLGGRKHGHIGIIPHIFFVLACVVLVPLYLAHAYLSYLWLSRGKVKTFVDYSKDFLDAAVNRSNDFSIIIGIISSCILSAIVWVAALLITPFVWVGEKITDTVSSKLDKTKKVEPYSETQDNANSINENLRKRTKPTIIRPVY